MVRRIREVLRLEAESEPVTVDHSTFPVDGTIEEVAGVELDTWLVRGDVERAAARRLDDARRMPLPRTCSIEHEVVIVPTRNLQLLVRLGDTRTDRGRLAEVERGTLHGR